MTFSIVIGSYGSENWKRLAEERAYPTARAQDEVDEVLIYHDDAGTVASVRNALANSATSDYLVFLDADDELAPSYIAAMKDALAADEGEGPLLLTPAVSYVRANGRRKIVAPPKFWPEVAFSVANWMVIGTAIPKSLFLGIGGFADEPAFGAFEDYELWIRAHKAGARILKVPDAVYIAWRSHNSRHRGATSYQQALWHYEIGQRHYPEIYDESWLLTRTRGRRPR